jgi:hypothetical protein
MEGAAIEVLLGGGDGALAAHECMEITTVSSVIRIVTRAL